MAAVDASAEPSPEPLMRVALSDDEVVRPEVELDRVLDGDRERGGATESCLRPYAGECCGLGPIQRIFLPSGEISSFDEYEMTAERTKGMVTLKRWIWAMVQTRLRKVHPPERSSFSRR